MSGTSRPVASLPILEVLEARLLLSAQILEVLDPGLTSPGNPSFWIDFDVDDDRGPGAEVEIEILSSSAAGLEGQMLIPGVWLEPLTLGDGKFIGLTIPECGYTNVVGDPRLPIARQFLVAPEGAQVTAQILSEPFTLSMADVGIDYPLVPLQAPVPKVPGAQEAALLTLNEAVYETEGFGPTETIRVVETGRLAGQRLVMLEVAPVSYDPVQEELLIYNMLTFNVFFEGGEPVTPATAEDASPGLISLGQMASEDSKTGGRLLIVAHDDFAADLSAYVAHKTGLGWTVDLANTSTAGTTNTQIRNYVQSRYDDPATRPDALLLVGDTDRIPHFVGSGTGTPGTDLYYACMDGGDDWYPDLPVGRFSIADSSQLADVIGKTIWYETSSAGPWTTHAAFMAGDDNYDISEGTHNWVIDHYMDPLGYTSDRLYEVTYGATTQDVRDAFNDGRCLGIYGGHGSSTSWADGPAFSQSDVRNLTNTGEYPLIASFSCDTGDYAASECFMETWLRAPEKAGVVAVGSSVSSYWYEDDILEKSLFDAIYDDGYVEIGSAWNRAKELFLQHYGPTGMTRRYFEMYNIMGDPTVQVLGLEFGIRSPAELPMAYLSETYEYTLWASGGTEPYTWSLIGGALPDGLSLNTSTGIISGTPDTPAAATFTIQATDAGSASDSREFHLPVVTRLEITTPPELPTAFLNVPYAVTLEATGGTQPYTWSLLNVGDFEESDPGPGYVGGGTPMNWTGDDTSWQLTLPWSFPFYGTDYDSVYVCTNGFVDFASSTADYSNSQSELMTNVRIAPLWDDLRTDGGGDIYVTQTSAAVTIRWDGETYSGGVPVDFEAVLYRDGTIKFNYGAAHSGLSPTIGVSAGDDTHFTFSSRDGAGSIPANVSSLFTSGGVLPAGLSLDEATGEIGGTPTPTQLGEFPLAIGVQDAGTPQQTVARDFTLVVTDAVPLTVTLPDAATEGDGLLPAQGGVSVPTPVEAALVVTLASDDPSEVSLPSLTATILAGHTSATFDLLIEDDGVLDGTQWATITASAPGYRDGYSDIAVHDSGETATLTVTVPESATEGDGVLTDQGTVTVSAPPESDVVVNLASDDTTEADVPQTVTILAGQTSATFDVTIEDDTEIDGTQTATITAHVENWTDGSDTIGVLCNDRWVSVLLPAKVWEGQGTLHDAGTVIIGGTLPTDLEVTLDSDDPGELQVPAAVLVPAGETSVPFPLFVQNDTDYDGAQTVSVSATAPGLTGDSETIEVGDDDVHHFGVVPIADPQAVSVPFTMTITARDINDETIDVYSGAIDLTGTGDSGPLLIEINPGARESAAAGAGAAEAPVDATVSWPDLGGKIDLGVYHDYDALTADLVSYAAAYPEICRLVSIGNSVQGRDLWALKISDSPDLQEDEPEVKYVSTMHGDEPVGTEMCLYFTDLLLSEYGADPDITYLVDETEIWIVPLMNPDGRQAGTRGNANGFDLNRDFPEGAYTPIGNILDGPPMDTAGRQPETVDVMQWIADNSFTLSANFHTGALVVNYPYDNDGLGSVFSPTPDQDLFVHVSEAYSAHNTPMWNSPLFPHGITNGAEWYSIDGGMQDWNYRYIACNDLTIELSDEKWPLESTLPGFWADNQQSMLALVETAHMGTRGILTDAVTGLPLFGSVMVDGIDHPVFTDPDIGDYHRMLLPGTYDLTFAAPGYASRTVDDVVVSDGSVTRLNMALAPLGAGVVLADGRWTGEVAVHAVDTNVVLTADDGLGHTGASNTFDVVTGLLDHFQWSPIESPQDCVPFSVTLTAVDANGYTATDFTGPADLSGAIGAGEVTIGDGTLSWEQPMTTFWHDSRTQTIYLGSEIGHASTVTALALDVTTIPSQTMNNWTIRMKHTPLSSYSNMSWEGSGWTTVYQNNESVASTGWVNFEFSTPFDYNGVDNLMVDFSYNNTSYTSDGDCRYTDTAQTRTLYYYTDSSWGDPLNWSGSSSPAPDSASRVPNVKLVAGADVPIIPTVSGGFVNGVWTGNVRVLEAATGMYLRADDGAGHTGDSNTFDVWCPGVLDGFVWDEILTPQYFDEPFGTNVTAIDAYGDIVTDFNETVPLSGWTGTRGGVLYSCDFETDNGGWTATASWNPVGDWEWGVPTTGPGAAYSGEKVWATNLHGNYTNAGGHSYLSQAFDFTGFSELELRWQQWVDVFYSYDTAEVFVNGNRVYYRGISGPTSGYEQIVVDLSAYDGLSNVEVVFDLYATTVVDYPGWYIDDVEIAESGGATEVPITPETADFVNGFWPGPVTVHQVVDDMYLRLDDGNGHVIESNTFDVRIRDLLPPTRVTLVSDTGQYLDDRITNLDNSNSSKVLEFLVRDTVPGATVTVYADGTAIGSAAAVASSTTVVTDGSTDVADGSHSITARQSMPGGPESPDSPWVTVLVDTRAPMANGPDLNAVSDTGRFNNDDITQGINPQFDGVAGDLMSNGYASGVWKVVVSSDDGKSGTDNSAPFYSVVLPTLDEGDRAVTATVHDVAGNTYTTGGLPVKVDRIAPRVTAFGLSSTYSRWCLGTVDSSEWTSGRTERTAPWSVLDRLVLDLDETVFADPDDLSVTGQTGGPVSLTGPGGTASTRLTWDSAAYLLSDRYGLLLASGENGVRDLAGNPLDGEGAMDVFPSGDGAPGGDWLFDLNVLVADVSRGDGVVNVLDKARVRLCYGAVSGEPRYDALVDINGDCVINILDKAQVRLHYGDTLPPAAGASSLKQAASLGRGLTHLSNTGAQPRTAPLTATPVSSNVRQWRHKRAVVRTAIGRMWRAELPSRVVLRRLTSRAGPYVERRPVRLPTVLHNSQDNPRGDEGLRDSLLNVPSLMSLIAER